MDRDANVQLDRSNNVFTNFANSLFSTSRHHSRSMAATSTIRQYRTIAYIVGAVVLLWLFMKIWSFGSSVAPGKGPEEI